MKSYGRAAGCFALACLFSLASLNWLERGIKAVKMTVWREAEKETWAEAERIVKDAASAGP